MRDELLEVKHGDEHEPALYIPDVYPRNQQRVDGFSPVYHALTSFSLI